MPFFLSQRDVNSREQMEDPNCDREELFYTYRQFKTVNSLVSGWRKLYKRALRPLFLSKTGPASLLDIGFGGGDIPVNIAKWAKEDGIDLRLTAIENDPRAFEYVQQLDAPDNLRFRLCSSTDLAREGASFDAVISNHLVHHLDEQSLGSMLDETKKLSNHLVLFNDIERSDTGYLLFNLIARPVFRSSFITEDGLTSIRRSYTARELRELVPAGWQVRRMFPFRLILSYRHGSQ